MRLEELLAGFRSCIDNTSIYTNKIPLLRGPEDDESFSFRLYSIKRIPELITKLRTLNDDEGANKFSVRYVVSRKGELWFAQEGRPSCSIPGHNDMRDSCLAAGNIYFSPDFSRIIKITHCSEDFLPKVTCLIWPIAALFLMRAPVALPLEAEEYTIYDDERCIKTASHIIFPDMIEAILPPTLRAQIISANDPDRIEEHQGIPRARVRGGFFTGTSHAAGRERPSVLIKKETNNEGPPPEEASPSLFTCC